MDGNISQATNAASGFGKVCSHDRLARQCPQCEAAAEIARLWAALEQIGAVKLRPGEFYSEVLERCQTIVREALK